MRTVRSKRALAGASLAAAFSMIGGAAFAAPPTDEAEGAGNNPVVGMISDAYAVAVETISNPEPPPTRYPIRSPLQLDNRPIGLIGDVYAVAVHAITNNTNVQRHVSGRLINRPPPPPTSRGQWRPKAGEANH